MFVYRPLDLLTFDGALVRPVVTYYTGHFLTAGIGITDYWQASVVVPFFSRIRFEEPLVNPSPGPSDHARVGDIRVSSKIQAIDADKTRFGLAFEPFLTIPLGADDIYMGESSVTTGLNIIGDVLLTKRLRMALNLGAEFHIERIDINNIDLDHRLLTALGLAFDMNKDVTLSAEAHVNSPFGSLFADRDTSPLEFLGGVKWDIGNSGFTLDAGAGGCGICGARGAQFRGLLGLSYRRMNETYALKEQQDEEMRYVTLKISEDKPEFAVTKLDTDGDGVENSVDWCPDQQGGKAERGCPQEVYAEWNLKSGRIVTNTIHFAFGKATLTPSSFPTLDRVAELVSGSPQKILISVEGHTDAIGSDENNLKLSLARARAVYQYLMRKGVSPDKLRFEGFGERHPLADNDTEEGRAKNRRVEFLIKDKKK